MDCNHRVILFLSLMFQRFLKVVKTEPSLKCDEVACECKFSGNNSLRTPHGPNPDYLVWTQYKPF